MKRGGPCRSRAGPDTDFLPYRQLVEQGKLDLDEPAGKYIPEIDEVKMIDGSKPNKRITTRMLLTHTAGFSYTVGDSSPPSTIA